MAEKTAVLMDGGFVKKKLQQTNQRFPTVGDVVALSTRITAKPELAGVGTLVFRIYFYDAPPFEATAKNPIDGSILNFSATQQSRQNQALLQSLELQPNFAVRRGVLALTWWKLGKQAIKSLTRQPRQIAARISFPIWAKRVWICESVLTLPGSR